MKEQFALVTLALFLLLLFDLFRCKCDEFFCIDGSGFKNRKYISVKVSTATKTVVEVSDMDFDVINVGAEVENTKDLPKMSPLKTPGECADFGGMYK